MKRLIKFGIVLNLIIWFSVFVLALPLQGFYFQSFDHNASQQILKALSILEEEDLALIKAVTFEDGKHCTAYVDDRNRIVIFPCPFDGVLLRNKQVSGGAWYSFVLFHEVGHKRFGTDGECLPDEFAVNMTRELGLEVLVLGECKEPWGVRK